MDFQDLKAKLLGKRRELQQELDLSEQAKSLLENPLQRDFFVRTEAKIISVWKASKAEDVEGREQAFRYLAVLQDHEAHLKRFLQDPDFALAELERMMQE